MTRNLQLRGVGARTQEAYLRAVRQLAAFYRPTPNQFNEEQMQSRSSAQPSGAEERMRISFCNSGGLAVGLEVEDDDVTIATQEEAREPPGLRIFSPVVASY